MHQRPKYLNIALILIVISGIASVLEIFLVDVSADDLRDPAMLAFLSGTALVTAIVVAIPMIAMLKGRPWGRTAYLVLVLLIPLAYESGLVTAEDLATSTLTDRLSLISHALADFVAVLLLFSAPVNRWFDQAVEERRSARAESTKRA